MRSKRKLLFYAFIGMMTFCSLEIIAQEAPSDTTQPPRRVFRRPSVIISPEIQPDNKVVFRLLAPDANSVTVSGEWMSGMGASEPLVKNDTGLWTVTVGPLEPELYSYTFNVDGVRMIDPNNVHELRDGTRYLSFLIVPGKESELFEQKTGVPHGTISKVWYNSGVLGMDRRLYVYTPAGYMNSNQKYPVFYLLHGAGGDEDAWTTMGREAQIMDNLIAQGKAVPMIVVMTNGNANQAGAPNIVKQNTASMRGPDGTNPYAGKFEESVVKDVIPFIQKNYRTYTDKDHRAIAGLSMGGAHTQTITNNNPDLFSYIGVFSMGLMNFGVQPQDSAAVAKERDAKIEALKNSGYKLYWIGVGKDDFLYQSVVNLRQTLDKHNFKYTYNESTGGHSWTNWRHYLTEFAPLLFK